MADHSALQDQNASVNITGDGGHDKAGGNKIESENINANHVQTLKTLKERRDQQEPFLYCKIITRWPLQSFCKYTFFYDLSNFCTFT